ncbi:GDSL-type esterase/lipase family protein [Bacillus sp. SCS-153A]|uniref:GDSL-type esterase/lipase family protein n=1 Tax=Rossellomorea sedimentorum TaxID=3115294 RepID=UPI0039061DD9
MKLFKKLSSILIIGAVALSTPSLGHAKSAKKVDVDYVSLGDSLAAGQTPDKKFDSGYADYLKDRMVQSQYEVKFDKLGVSGYTSSQLLDDVLYNQQVESMLMEAEMITINIGANDVLHALQSGPHYAAASVGTVRKNLTIILQTIDALNPDVDVYVMGYYNPFPHLPETQQVELLPLLDILNTTIETASIANGDVFVPTADAIAKDATTFIPNPTDIHLSLEGYQVIAKEFWKHIDKSNK